MQNNNEQTIDDARIELLTRCRSINPDLVHGNYPFSYPNCGELSYTDLKWLLSTHEWNGIVGQISGEIPQGYIGLDLRGAVIRGSLKGLSLRAIIGGHQPLIEFSKEQLEKAAIHLEGVDLENVCFDDAVLVNARMENTDLRGASFKNANLQGAFFDHANKQLQEKMKSSRYEDRDYEEVKKRLKIAATHFDNANLQYAHMNDVILPYVHLKNANLYHASLRGSDLSWAILDNADLGEANLQEVILKDAHLENARFIGAKMIQANMSRAIFKGAVLAHASLMGAVFYETHFEGANLSSAKVYGWIIAKKKTVVLTDFRMAFFDNTTILTGIELSTPMSGFPLLADIRWQDVNLAVVNWKLNNHRFFLHRIVVVGDEQMAREGPREEQTNNFEAAARTYRQLSFALYDQGMSNQADYFAYRAQICQREVWLRQKRFGAALWSTVLNYVAGYGYRPWRSLRWYIATIISFAIIYIWLQHPANFRAALDWDHIGNALIFSITSFHGRGFFSQNTKLGDPIVAEAAYEAIIGLFLEITFIATFTQRYFSR